MKKHTCKDCRHFRQHYIRFGRSYREAHCGHCVHPRVKARTPDTAACPNFEIRIQEHIEGIDDREQ